jgi:hypothetical protein
MYFNVNVNVLKQIYCALVGVIKDWKSQNARYNCGGGRNPCILLYWPSIINTREHRGNLQHSVSRVMPSSY